MTTSSDVIRKMIDDVEGQLEAIDNGILQIEGQIDAYNDEIDALEDEPGAINEADMTDYLNNTKVPYFQSIWVVPPFFNTVYIEYGPNYGVYEYDAQNLTDWIIWRQPPTVPPDPAPDPIEIYIYEGVGWDSDVNIIGYQDNWDWVNDYLTKPLDEGASYGLIPNRDSLEGAKSLLEVDKLKLEESLIELESYAT